MSSVARADTVSTGPWYLMIARTCAGYMVKNLAYGIRTEWTPV
jgi:hypothetical protein